MALVAANWLLLLPALVLIAIIYGQIGNEELMLIDRFGDEYREYMKRTPRIIPRPAHRDSGESGPGGIRAANGVKMRPD
jgi:protein-S-isoprenylcysteine O-methyltransferase Ste14